MLQLSLLAAPANTFETTRRLRLQSSLIQSSPYNPANTIKPMDSRKQLLTSNRQIRKSRIMRTAPRSLVCLPAAKRNIMTFVSICVLFTGHFFDDYVQCSFTANGYIYVYRVSCTLAVKYCTVHVHDTRYSYKSD